MSDLIAVLNSDRTIKAVLNTDKNIKAVLNNGVNFNGVIHGGQYIHFDITTNGNGQTFTNNFFTEYGNVDNINCMKNGVYLEPTLLTKTSSNTIQINTVLHIGDTIDILATGSSVIGASIPGGGYTQVQYNDNGYFGGDSQFTFNSTTHLLTVGHIAGEGGNISNIAGANVSGTVANATAATTAGTVTTAAQPNITSTGTLTSLNVSGNTSLSSILTIASGREKLTYNSGTPSSTLTYNLTANNIVYYNTNANANVIVNFTNHTTVTANTSTVAVLVYNTGTTPYSVTGAQLSGSSSNILWPQGIAPTVIASSTIIYTFTIINKNGTYAILGSGTGYA